MRELRDDVSDLFLYHVLNKKKPQKISRDCIILLLLLQNLISYAILEIARNVSVINNKPSAEMVF